VRQSSEHVCLLEKKESEANALLSRDQGTTGQPDFLGAGGDRSVLMFEFLVLVIFGVLAGAELVNLFMLGRLPSSVSLVQAPVVMRRASSNKIM
jgi:hypothetical protein